jgi:HSP20 family protein
MPPLRIWDPFADLTRFSEEMNRRFALSPDSSGSAPAFRPAVDIFEDEEAIHIHAELPGLAADGVHLSVEDGVLTLSGERKLQKEEKKQGYHRIERSYGSFSRSFTLPDTVDTENVVADMKDGVLSVKLMKRARPEPKRIEVKGR